MTTLNAPQDRARHDGPLESQLDHAFGQIHLSVGAYHEALRALRRVVDAGGGASAAADLVEAALRSGSVDEATETAARLAGWTAEHDRPLERGLLARVSALLAADQDAEVYYQRSIADLSAVPDRLEAARSQLLYGEWLRRQRRRVDARVALRAAFRTFDQRPSRAFADRARGELLATCALARPGSSETPTALTSLTARGRPGGRPGTHEPGGRGQAVPQSGHSRLPPPQGVQEARHSVETGAHRAPLHRHVTRRHHQPGGRRWNGRDTRRREWRRGRHQETNRDSVRSLRRACGHLSRRRSRPAWGAPDVVVATRQVPPGSEPLHDRGGAGVRPAMSSYTAVLRSHVGLVQAEPLMCRSRSGAHCAATPRDQGVGSACWLSAVRSLVRDVTCNFANTLWR